MSGFSGSFSNKSRVQFAFGVNNFTTGRKSISLQVGPTFLELVDARAGIEIFDRSSVNAFDDERWLASLIRPAARN